MPIYGVGSNWDGEEMREQFFQQGQFILGWNEQNAEDLYAFIASLKAGDILYLKSNQPGSRTIRVKGIGIVRRSVISCISSGALSAQSMNDWNQLFVEVAWVCQDEFQIEIPPEQGRLTNVRAATLYEEYLPVVQDAIVSRVAKA